MEKDFLTFNQLLLLILLIKVGVFASLATLLIRTQTMKTLLFTGNRGLRDNFALTGILSGLTAFGVIARLLLGYHAVDLSLSGTLVAGLLMGPFYGGLTGLVISVPAMIWGEIYAAVFGVLCGISAGILRHRFRDRDEIWEFSPFQYFNSIQMGRKKGWREALTNPRTHVLFLCVIFESLRMVFTHFAGSDKLFALVPSSFSMVVCVYLSTIACVGIPLKIWNNTRVEIMLEEREKQLLKTRYEVLRSQINPHFLFNTLNSIASLIRTDPNKARDMVVNLSGVLRTLLKEQRDLVPVKEEIELIDKYLAIEKTRFGDETLKVIKDIDPGTYDLFIPGMMLQPLVENAIKHGLSKRIGGGTVHLEIRKTGDKLLCTVSDDGIGTKITNDDDTFKKGIGLSNIRERLQMIYGDRYNFHLSSEPHRGTIVSIEIPLF